MVDVSALMVTQSSDQAQTEGQNLAPPNDPEETETSFSTPLHSWSQSPVRRPMSDCPDTQYCLEIQVILTEEGGAMPPTPHTCQVSLVEDMLCDSKSGLIEAIVIGPGWAILFYGRQLLGEGFCLGEAQDTMFTLSGTCSWFDKQAEPNTNALACSKTGDWSPKPSPNNALMLGDPDVSVHICLHHCHLGFAAVMGRHRKRVSRVLMSMWRSPGMLIRHHTMIMCHGTAGTAARGGKTHWQHQPQPPHLHLATVLRVTEVQCQPPHQCCCILVDLGASDTCTMGYTTGSPEAIWRSICLFSRMRTRKMPSIIKVGVGL